MQLSKLRKIYTYSPDATRITHDKEDHHCARQQQGRTLHWEQAHIFQTIQVHRLWRGCEQYKEKAGHQIC